MVYKQPLKWLLTAVMVGWLIISCQGAAVKPTRLTVSAAASLQGVLLAIAPAFATTHPEIEVVFNFAASGALQRQIEQGAPVDIFIPAAAQPMDALEQQGLIRATTRRDLLANRLVLIAAPDSPLQIQRLEQLKTARFDHLAVGEFRTVPAGQYAQQALAQLELLNALQTQLVFGRNVRGVLAAVEQGNAELGLVYATDADRSDRVRRLLTVPESTHDPIRYPIAILQASEQTRAAQQWLTFLQGDIAQAEFAAFGFLPLP
ncbi:MAG: molybdate ABC transporter substrate-binding protein [Spirulinaceae cyanobacterium]